MTQYVTDPVKIKLLLTKCPTLETMLVNLIIELQVIYKQGTGIIVSSDEIMQAMAIGSQQISDMPRSTSAAPGDKMTNIIESYQKILDDEYGELLKLIRDDIFMIDSVVGKISNAIERLPPEQKEVLTFKYWQNRSWGQIADTMRITEGQAKRLHKIAVVERLCKELNIGLESYEYVMEKAK